MRRVFLMVLAGLMPVMWSSKAVADEGVFRELLLSGDLVTSGAGAVNPLAVSAAHSGSVGILEPGSFAVFGPISPPPFTDPVNGWVFLNHSASLEGDGQVSYSFLNYDASAIDAVDDAVDASLTFNGLVALKSDGTLVGAGPLFEAGGILEIPATLDQVVDVDIGFRIGLALKADGTVVQWGVTSTPPAGLADVIAIDVGDATAIALKSDGTVVVWGDRPGVAEVPAGVTDVYSVHSSINGEAFAVLKTDGTLETFAPDPGAGSLDGPDIVGTTMGFRQHDQVAIRAAGAVPCARVTPLSTTKDLGTPHVIRAETYAPVATYQWKLDGVDLAGETKPFLFIPSISAGDAGDYTLEMTNVNGTVVTGASTLALTKENQVIDFSALADKAFGDPDFDVTATADSGLPVEFSIVSGPATISGATVSITGSGTVVVRADQPGDDVYNAAPSVDQSFSVAGLPAMVTLSGLTHVYDGFGKAATVTTVPAGLSVAVTYNGDPTAPSGAGDYAVVAEIDEPGYVGSATDTLSIAKATQTIDFMAIDDVTLGVVSIPLVGTASSGLEVEFGVISGDALVEQAAFLNVFGAGPVSVRAFQLGDDNYEPALVVDRSFNVDRASQVIDFPSVGTQTFGAAPFAPQVSAFSGLPINLVVVSGPATASVGILTLTGAGNVTVRVEQGGNDDWFAATPIEQTFVVEKRAQLIDAAVIGNKVFDAGPVSLNATASSELEVTWTVVTGPATIENSELTITGAGDITVRASQAGDDDYLAAPDVDRSFLAGYSLTVIPTSGGDAGASPAKLVYAPGEEISLSMVEYVNYRFTGWGGDLSGVDNPTTLLMDGNKIVDANFKRIWALDVTSNVGGSVTVSPDKAEYLEGDVVTLTPVAEEGYALSAWTGDAAGADDPLMVTMSADTQIAAQFVDDIAPVLTIFSPAAGVTNNQFSALFGSVSDNDSVSSVRWERDGVDKGQLNASGGTFSVTNLVLNQGENLFRVFAVDPEGNEGQTEVTITWEPDRTLSLYDPPEVKEGKLVTVPISLNSSGQVGGMTFVVAYDDTFLRDPSVVLSGPAAGGINQVNTDVSGEVRVTLALPATTLPAGDIDLGSVTFRARSVPFDLSTQFGVEVLDVAGADGNQISFGTHKVGSEGRILQRTYQADINTNDKLDTGDAFLLQRLLAGFDETRTWDHPLNDLNNSNLVDSGDVIRVLRAVVGLDSQPGAPQGKPRRAARSNHAGAHASLIADQSYGFDGDEITVQVRLDDIGYAPSGASFTLEYPVESLRLTNTSSHTTGAMVPAGTFVLWNVFPSQNDYANQSGKVSFGASSSSVWSGAENGGVLAEFVFKVQPGAAAQAFWPITLRAAEVPSADGFDILELPTTEIEFLGQATTYDSWLETYFNEAERSDDVISGHLADPDGDGRDNLTEYGMGSNPTGVDSDSGTAAEVVDDSGVIGFRRSLTAVDLTYSVEVSGDLGTWNSDDGDALFTEELSAERSEDGRSEWLRVRDVSGGGVGRRFLRVRFAIE